MLLAMILDKCIIVLHLIIKVKRLIESMYFYGCLTGYAIKHKQEYFTCFLFSFINAVWTSLAAPVLVRRLFKLPITCIANDDNFIVSANIFHQPVIIFLSVFADGFFYKLFGRLWWSSSQPFR